MVQPTFKFFVRVVAAFLFFTTFSVFGDDTFSALIQKGSYEKAVQYAENGLPQSKRTIAVWVDLATAYSKMGKKEDALEALKAAQKINPSEPTIFRAYGDYYFENKQFTDALQSYQKSYLLDRTAQAVEGIALSAAKLKDWDKARDAAESAVNLDSTLYEPRLILIDLFLKEADYQSAAGQLEFAVKKKPSRVLFWKQLSLCYDSIGNKQGLARADERIVALDKKDAAARHRLASYFLKEKKTDKAYELYKEIAVLTPNDQRPFEELYKIAKAKNNQKDATLYLKNYLLIDSTDASYYKDLGDLLYAQKDAEGALEAYRQALKLNPNITGLYKNYSSILIEKKLEDEAVKIITKAIDAKEADAKMLIALGDIYGKRKKHSDAVKMYQAALETDTKNISVLTSLAESQALAGDPKNAITTYEQVVLLNPDANDEYKQLGLLNMRLSRQPAAMESFKKYLKKTPADAETARNVGLYEYKKKNHAEAVKYLSMVKDKKFHTTEYLISLGDSYYSLGKFKEASDYFARVVAGKPDESVLKAILKPLGESMEKTGNMMEAANAYDRYISLPGVKDRDVAYKRAVLRESADQLAAIGMYNRNTSDYPDDYRNFMRLGLIHAQKKSTLSKSVQMLEKAAALVDSISTIWETMGVVYGKLNKTDKELYAFKKLLDLQPQDVQANKRVGLILLDKGQTSSALVNLEVALTGAPEDNEILLALGDGYLKTKRPKEASQALTKAAEIKPQDVEIRLKLMDAYTAAGMKEEADKEQDKLAALDKSIVSKDKKNIDSRQRLAQYSLEKNDLKTAYSLYQDLSSLTPEDSAVFKRLYLIAVKTDQPQNAIKHLKSYLALDSTSAGAYKSLGNLLYDRKNMDGALDAYRRAVKLDPAITDIYKRYIDIVLSKGLEKEAIEVINAAIKAGEADTKAYTALGDIYKKKKDWNNAVKVYQEVLKKDARNVEVLTSLARCQAAGGDTRNAVITYEQVVLINSNASTEYKELGDLHMKLKNEENGVEAYKKYLKKNTRDEETARTVGLYEYKENNYKQALTYLNMVGSDKLRDVQFHAALGLSYYHVENFRKAAEMLAQVQAMNPSSTIRRETIRPLAESYEKAHMNKEAADAYHEYTLLAGIRDDDASYKKAFLREKTDRAGALKIYNSNTSLFPNDYRNFLRLGLIYAQEKDNLKESAAMLSKASELIDTLPIIWQTLGLVHGKLGNETQELSAYKKLLALTPQELEANKRVGTILLKQGKTADALAALEIALTVAPEDVDIMMLLAQGYEKTNRPKQAIELLSKAKEKKKTDSGIRMQLYKLYKNMGQGKKAEEEIKGLVALTKDVEHRKIYAVDLINQKRFEEATSQVKAIRESAPMNVDGLMLLAAIQLAQNNLTEAIETYKMVSYVDDAYAPAFSARADIYLKQNQVSRAKEYYQKALKFNARYAPAELGLARVAKANKDAASYQRHLNKAKTLDPQNEQVLLELKGTEN